VALKLAQFQLIERKKQHKPFLFLDDLMDKFDPERVDHIMAMVRNGQFGQVFISDTSPQRLAVILKKYNLEHQMIVVENAAISQH
jgi:DNA replication and repair protein RecF